MLITRGWPKTIRDVLTFNGWRDIQARMLTYQSPDGRRRVRSEFMGRYRGYGFRLSIRMRQGRWRSFFIADEFTLASYLFGP